MRADRVSVAALVQYLATMRRLPCALVLLAACGGDSESTEALGLDLVVRFGSQFPISTLKAEATWKEDGTEVVQAVLPYVGPPITRSVGLRIDLPASAAGLDTVVVVVGRAPDGERLVQGQTTLAAAVDGRTSAEITLAPPSVCGDGFWVEGECDDGNQVAGDGCSAECRPEPGYTCTGQPSRCRRCGDGRVDAPEACDDGNQVDGDGCSSTCQTEAEVEVRWTRQWRWAALETDTPTFSEVAFASLEPDAADRIVFVSGTLAGDQRATVGLELALDETVIDEFGHEVRGPATDRGPGFVTFEVVPADAASRRLSVRLRSSAGAGRVRDLRIIAARVPPGADLSFISRDAEPERTGYDVVLDRLDIPAEQAGRYLILAKMSLTERPGNSTAQGWLELPDRRRQPVDERGASFSASREPLSPLFTAAVLDVAEGGSSVRLKGHSSGTEFSSLENWAAAEARFRQPLNVSGPASPGYAVRFSFDHARHVALGRSEPNGDDVIVMFSPNAAGEAPRPLHRVVDPGSDWNRSDTTLWFRLAEDVPSDGSGQYAIYFGGPTEVLDDPQQVFAFYDDFTGSTLDPARWRFSDDEVDNNLSIDGGQLSVRGRATLVARAGAPPTNSRWEARLRLTAERPNGLTYLGVGALGSLSARFEGGAFTSTGDGHRVETLIAGRDVEIQAPLGTHVYAITRADEQTVDFAQDDTDLASLIVAPTTEDAFGITIANEGTDAAVYDWVRVRPYVSPEPSVSVDELQGAAGVAASRFRYRKLAALRLDAWAAANLSEESEQAVRTQGEYTEVAALTAAQGEGPRLVLQSVRVGGANDADRRRRGEVRLDDEVIRSTEHRIDRDDSAANGYHHVAGLVHVLTATASGRLSVGISSPDGIDVSGVDGRIVILEFPR